MTRVPHPDDILARLRRLYPVLIDLSLGRLEALLERLGHPERRLPPVIHVAGTNGKGSTCAFLRAIAEAAGLRTHVMTSPHLVSITERFRLGSRLVTLDALSAALAEVEQVNAGHPITVFEALTAAGILLFSRAPADLAIVEVGLGGRFDATNVVTGTRVAAITSISRDHENFLGSQLSQIAGEKAGIMRPGRPCVTGRQEPEALVVLEEAARQSGARLLRRDRDWTVERRPDRIHFEASGGPTLDLPPPGLIGLHQVENAGIAIAAMLQAGLDVPARSYAAVETAVWPGRMQRLSGALRRMLAPNFEVWLDGGHNEGGANAIAATLDLWFDRPRYLVVGMKDTKDPERFLAPLLPRASDLFLVREEEQDSPAALEALLVASGGKGRAGPTIERSIRQIASLPPGRVLICGSLHLAGAALRQDGTIPD